MIYYNYILHLPHVRELCLTHSLTLLDNLCSLLDEIVLNYVAGIVDDISLLDTDNTGDDDSFDVEDFVEMMDAYLPGFAQIPR